MAATRDSPLTKEEQEEEEMRHELSNMGFYEENMRIEEMRQIIQAVNESKSETSAYMNVDTSLDESHTNPTKSQSSPEAAKAILERPLPSYSYRNAGLASGSTTTGPAYEQLKKKDKSPESMYDPPFETNTNSQTDGPGNESNYEKEFNLQPEEYPGLNYKSSNSKGNFSGGSRVLRSHDKKKPTAAMITRANLERWRMNPFEMSNDEPPKDSEEPVPKLNMELLSDEFLESQKFKDMLEQVGKELDKLNEQFMDQVPKTVSQTKLGSPIKVATKSGWNNSLDKNPFHADKPAEEPAGRAGPSGTGAVSTRGERATKRKALNNMAAVLRDDSSHENRKSDDSADEFIDTKRRKKIVQAKKGEESAAAKKNKEAAKSKEAASADVENDFEMIDIDGQVSVKEDNDLMDCEPFDNSDLHALRKNKTSNNADVSQNSKIVEDRPQYPIKVLPPNPAKKNYKGPRAREKNKKPPVAQTENNNAIKKRMGISDEEISDMLNTIDEHIEDNDCVEITDEVESPATKPIQKKIQAAKTLLKNQEARELEEQQRLRSEEEAKKKKDEEKAQRKNESVKKRLQAMVEDTNNKDEKDKEFSSQEALYDNLFMRRPVALRSIKKKPPKPSYEDADEELLLGDDDDEPMITHITHATIAEKKSPCPICQKPFPADKIEEHASGCDAFLVDDDISEPSTSYENNYSCNICKKYRTSSGINYEEHMVRCKQEADDKRTGIYA